MNIDNKERDPKPNHTLEQNVQASFKQYTDVDIRFSDERLKEMNKTLPEWSLEPPDDFLK